MLSRLYLKDTAFSDLMQKRIFNILMIATLNSDKFRILKQRNWNCSTEKARRDFGFVAPTTLAEGIEKSVEWYEKAGWFDKKSGK